MAEKTPYKPRTNQQNDVACKNEKQQKKKKEILRFLFFSVCRLLLAIIRAVHMSIPRAHLVLACGRTGTGAIPWCIEIVLVMAWRGMNGPRWSQTKGGGNTSESYND